jgi:ATP-dependent protease HslVU (ClpYQ) peptidase subunit
MPSKVFRNTYMKNVIMGGTTTFRHLDLLKYSETLFSELDSYKKPTVDHKYMVTKFIPNVITLFKDGIVDEAEKDRGANFIVGVDNKLFEVQPDYSVLEPEDGICSVGCGDEVAMGSLLTTKGMKDLSVPQKITLALEAAEHYLCGVQRPFKIINTKTDEEIVIT